MDNLLKNLRIKSELAIDYYNRYWGNTPNIIIATNNTRDTRDYIQFLRKKSRKRIRIYKLNKLDSFSDEQADYIRKLEGTEALILATRPSRLRRLFSGEQKFRSLLSCHPGDGITEFKSEIWEQISIIKLKAE